MKFKSTFFGTFASNTLLIAPAAIDFKAIFGNFLERITETPQVLITFVVLFILVIILTVLLRRLDNKDQLYVSCFFCKLFFDVFNQIKNKQRFSIQTIFKKKKTKSK